MQALRMNGRIGEALDELERSAERNPDWTVPLTGRAWILATDPDASVRDPATAVRLAERALELAGRNDVRGLDILAAAQAAAGRFHEARATASREETLELVAERARPGDCVLLMGARDPSLPFFAKDLAGCCR